MKHLNALSFAALRWGLLATVAFLGACAWQQDPNNMPPFGDSVRQEIAAQTSVPNYGARGLDGVKAELGFQKWQHDVASPSEVQKQMKINVQ
jgi:hypothetical protein